MEFLGSSGSASELCSVGGPAVAHLKPSERFFGTNFSGQAPSALNVVRLVLWTIEGDITPDRIGTIPQVSNSGIFGSSGSLLQWCFVDDL